MAALPSIIVEPSAAPMAVCRPFDDTTRGFRTHSSAITADFSDRRLEPCVRGKKPVHFLGFRNVTVSRFAKLEFDENGFCRLARLESRVTLKEVENARSIAVDQIGGIVFVFLALIGLVAVDGRACA
jgi:hypothetical protein